MNRHDPPEANAFRLEVLVGRTVVDDGGRRVGRIKEVLAERTADACELTEVLVAPRRVVDFFRLLAAALGHHHDPDYDRVPWRLLDVSDPRQPRLRCSVEEWRRSVTTRHAHPPA